MLYWNYEIEFRVGFMEKEKFVRYVKDLILPLFTGSEIIGEETSSNRDSEVALGASGTVLIKGTKLDEYRLILKRSQVFKLSDVVLLRSIIKEIQEINELNLHDKTYETRMLQTAIEKAICYSLTETAGETLLNIIMELSNSSNRTYEGRKLDFGIIVNDFQSSENQTANTHYTNLFKSDFFALISDGLESAVEFDKDGYLIGYVPLDKVRNYPTVAPIEYTNIARVCNERKIGLVLTNNGEILIFKNRSLVYAKKRGNWESFFHEEIINLLASTTNRTLKEIRRSLYLTALDSSFAGTGACLVCLNKERTELALDRIDINDIITSEHFEIKKQLVNEDARKLYNIDQSNTTIDDDVVFSAYINNNKNIKSENINRLVAGKKFQEVNRKLRQEIAGIDGATIIDWDGTIIAVGAIIKIEAGSTGGGRLAATKTLAKYGVALKVSTDGTIQGFTRDKRNNKVKELFTVG